MYKIFTEITIYTIVLINDAPVTYSTSHQFCWNWINSKEFVRFWMLPQVQLRISAFKNNVKRDHHSWLHFTWTECQRASKHQYVCVLIPTTSEWCDNATGQDAGLFGKRRRSLRATKTSNAEKSTYSTCLYVVLSSRGFLLLPRICTSVKRLLNTKTNTVRAG